MSRLADHRRFAAATAVWVTAAGAVLCILFLLSGRGSAAGGVAAGCGVALVDILLTVRGLDRLSRRGLVNVGSRGIRGGLMSRFLAVAVLIGVVICARGVNPVGVVVGFMLLPFSIIGVGITSLWSEAHASRRRVRGAAG